MTCNFFGDFSPIYVITNYRVRQNKRPHCAKCIIVPVVLNFTAKFSDADPRVVYRLRY